MPEQLPSLSPLPSSDFAGNGNVTIPLLPSHNQEHQKMVIDEMLQKYCGEFGSWQFKHFFLTCSAWILVAFHTMVMIFTDREPAWRCTGSGMGCDYSTRSVCELEPGAWEWVGGSGVSTVAEWGLVCGEKYKVGLAKSAFFAGCVVGAGVFGHLSDSFLGRKGCLTVVCIMNSIIGCVTALSPSYWIYTALRFVTGIGTGGVGLCAFVLATEPIGPSSRGTVGMSTFYFFSTGIAILSGIAYISRSWRSLYIASSLPSIVFVIAFIPYIAESPRWYLIRGRVNDAMAVMRDIAKGNGNHLPSEVIVAMDDDTNSSNQKQELVKEKEALTGSLVDVVLSPVTRSRLLLTVGINFLCSVVYYGLSLNVVNLKTNLYITVLLNAVVEMPAFTLTALLLRRLGRKPLTIGTMWFSGIFCLGGSLIRNYGAGKVIRMVCGMFGIFGMAGTYNLLFIYIAELFPTVVRNAALGCSTQAGHLGAILSPFVVVLGGGLPFAVFGVCGIIGGTLVFYLPETRNRPLYDTMVGMEDEETWSRGV